MSSSSLNTPITHRRFDLSAVKASNFDSFRFGESENDAFRIKFGTDKKEPDSHRFNQQEISKSRFIKPAGSQNQLITSFKKVNKKLDSAHSIH